MNVDGGSSPKKGLKGSSSMNAAANQTQTNKFIAASRARKEVE